ncbi:ALF repeat-containing protein [Amycolatopsis sp. NPDC051114]|uniref:ALF repeat-containing protein n=1 Tax=Amycolatopsis sp. NPDC051114 TaxID=3155280 RepID=UPI003440B45D
MDRGGFAGERSNRRRERRRGARRGPGPARRRQGGPATKSAAQQALDGTVADVRAFLATGQCVARTHDLRIRLAQTLSEGPEVTAVAQGVLDGPDSYLQPYLDNDLAKARARDAFTAEHAAKVNALLSQLP